MFQVKSKAEVRQLTTKRQASGDAFVAADEIKLMLLEVPVDKISSAIPGARERLYDEDGEVAMGEINPLTVHHKIGGAKANIAIDDGYGVTLEDADIKKGMKIHLLPEYLANVELVLQVPEVGSKDHGKLRNCYVYGEVDVEILEMQIDLCDA